MNPARLAGQSRNEARMAHQTSNEMQTAWSVLRTRRASRPDRSAGVPDDARLLVLDSLCGDGSKLQTRVSESLPGSVIEWIDFATLPAQLAGRYAYCIVLTDASLLQTARLMQAIATIRNVHCPKIDLMLAPEPGARQEALTPDCERSVLGLGFRQIEWENDAPGYDQGIRRYRYELGSYNKKRRWNTPENWANPENFHRYRW